MILVGVDGASWNAIDPLLEAGALPNFQELARRGITAKLRAVKPVNSPAVWSTIATCRRPRAHGVTDFYSTRFTLRVPTVFERLAVGADRLALRDAFVRDGFSGRHDPTGRIALWQLSFETGASERDPGLTERLRALGYVE